MGLSSGHSELFVAISQLKELRTTTKAQIAAQESAIDDLNKWSSKENNRGLIEYLSINPLFHPLSLQFYSQLSRMSLKDAANWWYFGLRPKKCLLKN